MEALIENVTGEIPGSAMDSSGIETSVLSYGGTSILTSVRFKTASLNVNMFCLAYATKNNKRWPISDLLFSLITFKKLLFI